jgi:hypothetical protein
MPGRATTVVNGTDLKNKVAAMAKRLDLDAGRFLVSPCSPLLSVTSCKLRTTFTQAPYFY